MKTDEEILAMNIKELQTWLCDCDMTKASEKLQALRRLFPDGVYKSEPFICKDCNEITSAKFGTEQQKAGLCHVCFLLDQRRKR